MSLKQPDTTLRIRNGLNLPMKGRPQQAVHAGPAIDHVALCGPDYAGLKPRLLVSEGDEVGLGQPLFVDKSDPEVPYVSPGRGTITAIHRGARRVLESVVVRLGNSSIEDRVFEPLRDENFTGLDRAQAVDRLQQSGLWTQFRTRPFNRVPMSGTLPDAVFVTAIDTRPLAANPVFIVAGHEQAFADGLRVLRLLPSERVFLCTAPDWTISLPLIENVHHAEFSGPHPAGLVGTHMHFLYPVGRERTAWHIGYQDVIAIGRLFREGIIDTRKVVALGGEGVMNPRLVESRRGASVAQLLEGEIENPDISRVIAGSVLGGRTASGGLAFLGCYQNQVSVISEGLDRHFLGWTGLLPRRYSAARTFLRMSGHKNRLFMSSSQNGRYSGMLPTRAFEKVLPLDILPSPLLRALLVKDTDQAQALGCLELAEEDLALCSFVCPAKNDYATALRLNLAQIEKDG